MKTAALERLEENYPEIISQMNSTFNSHEFILKFAHQFQNAYVNALAEYNKGPYPFQIVHGAISKRLKKFPDLVTHVGEEPSIDIFNKSSSAALWKKVDNLQ